MLSVEITRGLKPRYFWATHIIQKWDLFPFNMPWCYQIFITNALYSLRDDLPKIGGNHYIGIQNSTSSWCVFLMLKLPMDAIKNYHGCSQQCSHKIAGKYVSCTHLWILSAIASICVTSGGPCWLGATCKNVFHASSVKKCIVLTSNCLVKVAKAKHLVAVWKILVWYRGYRGFKTHLCFAG